MATATRRLVLRYGAALLATGAALALRWAMEPWLDTNVPFITIFGAVAFVAWYGGVGPAVVATLLGAIGIEYLFEFPREGFAFFDLRALIIYSVYAAMCGVVTLLAALARRHAQRAEQAAAALQEDHLLRQQMIDALPMLVSYVDADTCYRFNNRAYELWFGHDRSEISGRAMRDVLGEAAWQRVRPSVERALAGEPVHFATELDYKDAGRRAVNVSYMPHDVGGAVIGFFVLVEDISERRRAERAQAHLAAVVSSSDDAILSKGLDGVITSWNRGAELLYGYSAVDMIGQTTDRLIPEELRAEETEILQRIGKGERLDHMETERLTCDGRRVAVSLSISPILDVDGRVVGVSKIARDISGRKAADQALRDSEQRFRTLAESTPMLVWRTDDADRAVWFNQCWLDFTGSPMDAEAGSGWLRHLHPDDRRRVVASRGAAQAHRAPIEAEYRLRHNDGSYRWVYERATPMHDGPAGAFSGYIGSCIDITDRRHAEDELRRTFESIGDGFFVLDAQGRFVYVNAIAEEAVGHRREDLLGRVFWDVFPLTRQTVLEREFARCMDGAVVDFENFYAPFNRWYRNRCFPRAGGGITVYFQDVTAEKRARRTLQQSEEKFHKAFDTSPNVLAITTLGSDSLVEVNAAFERLTGYPRQSVIGATTAGLGLWVDIERREQLLWQLRAGESVRDVELGLRTRDGALRTVLLSAELLELDETPCVVASWLDVSDQRELERRLRESVERLADADRRKDEFLATLAHELRNPLAPILSSAQFLQRGTAVDPSVQRARAIIERQARHMARLVDDLLDLARISRGQVTLRRARVSLRVAIESAVEACAPQLEEAGHELHLDIPEEAVCVDGDFTRLAQVVGNLLGNAIKYTPPGGGDCHRTFPRSRAGRHPGARLRHRHPSRHDRAHLRHVHAIRQCHRAQQGRARDRAHAVAAADRDARWQPQRTQRGHRGRQRVRGAAAVGGGSVDTRRGARAPARSRCRTTAADPGRRRQRRCGDQPRHAARTARPRGEDLARRCGRRRRRGGSAPGRGAARHRHAANERLRGCPPHPCDAGWRLHPAGGGDRLGPGRGPATHARSRLRRARHQAGRVRGTAAVAGGRRPGGRPSPLRGGGAVQPMRE
jgi:PAS domain S-box-containing protein